jgi:hypothetical protein
MTQNHDLKTPQEGTLDWHIPLNENFRAIERRLPIVDTDAAKSNYEPYAKTLYVAADTGTMYVGDGSSWVKVGNRDDTDSGSDSPSLGGQGPSPDVAGVRSNTDTGGANANVFISEDNGTYTLERDGGTITSTSDSDQVFEDMASAVNDGDYLYVEPGTYTIRDVVPIYARNFTFENRGTIRLDDGGSPAMGMFRFHADGAEVFGGTFDFDATNNEYDGLTGTQAVFGLWDASTDHYFHDVTARDAFDAFVMGRSNSNTTVEHCDFEKSRERGVYLRYASNVEIRHSRITRIHSGAIRTYQADNWYVHDNYLTTEYDSLLADTHDGGFCVQPTYLMEQSPQGVTIERDYAVSEPDCGGGAFVWVNYNDAGPVENFVVRDGYYESDGAPFEELRDVTDSEIAEFSFESNEYQNVDQAYPSLHS